jgi:hypothetical protein
MQMTATLLSMEFPRDLGHPFGLLNSYRVLETRQLLPFLQNRT